LAVVHLATAGPLTTVACAVSAITLVAAALFCGVLGVRHSISPFGFLPAYYVLAKGLTGDI
jgi:hypothetical protein